MASLALPPLLGESGSRLHVGSERRLRLDQLKANRRRRHLEEELRGDWADKECRQKWDRIRKDRGQKKRLDESGDWRGGDGELRLPSVTPRDLSSHDTSPLPSPRIAVSPGRVGNALRSTSERTAAERAGRPPPSPGGLAGLSLTGAVSLDEDDPDKPLEEKASAPPLAPVPPPGRPPPNRPRSGSGATQRRPSPLQLEGEKESAPQAPALGSAQSDHTEGSCVDFSPESVTPTREALASGLVKGVLEGSLGGLDLPEDVAQLKQASEAEAGSEAVAPPQQPVPLAREHAEPRTPLGAETAAVTHSEGMESKQPAEPAAGSDHSEPSRAPELANLERSEPQQEAERTGSAVNPEQVESKHIPEAVAGGYSTHPGLPGATQAPEAAAGYVAQPKAVPSAAALAERAEEPPATAAAAGELAAGRESEAEPALVSPPTATVSPAAAETAEIAAPVAAEADPEHASTTPRDTEVQAVAEALAKHAEDRQVARPLEPAGTTQVVEEAAPAPTADLETESVADATQCVAQALAAHANDRPNTGPPEPADATQAVEEAALAPTADLETESVADATQRVAQASAAHANDRPNTGPREPADTTQAVEEAAPARPTADLETESVADATQRVAQALAAHAASFASLAQGEAADDVDEPLALAVVASSAAEDLDDLDLEGGTSIFDLTRPFQLSDLENVGKCEMRWHRWQTIGDRLDGKTPWSELAREGAEDSEQNLSAEWFREHWSCIRTPGQSLELDRPSSSTGSKHFKELVSATAFETKLAEIQQERGAVEVEPGVRLHLPILQGPDLPLPPPPPPPPTRSLADVDAVASALAAHAAGVEVK